MNEIIFKETKVISVYTIFFSAFMQLVFLALQKWDNTVLLGNLLSGSAAILNFLLLGITVEKAVSLEEKQKAKIIMRVSQLSRLAALFLVAILGAVSPHFNLWATLIPLLFPRLAITVNQAVKLF